MPVVPGAHEVDPDAEMARLAGERSHGPAKVLHIGDVIRVYTSTGAVFTGRVEHVAAGVPDPARDKFGVICTPAGGDEGA